MVTDAQIVAFLEKVDAFLATKDLNRKRPHEPLYRLPQEVIRAFAATIGRSGFGQHRSAKDDIEFLLSQTSDGDLRQRLERILQLL